MERDGWQARWFSNMKCQREKKNWRMSLVSPGYEGHSLSMLRRVAEALHARVRVVFEPDADDARLHVAESSTGYEVKK